MFLEKVLFGQNYLNYLENFFFVLNINAILW